jgi:hypothetical protein
MARRIGMAVSLVAAGAVIALGLLAQWSFPATLVSALAVLLAGLLCTAAALWFTRRAGHEDES